jgi:hypothetical protein
MIRRACGAQSPAALGIRGGRRRLPVDPHQGPVRAEGMLKFAFFHDPDGNELYLAEPARRAG